MLVCSELIPGSGPSGKVINIGISSECSCEQIGLIQGLRATETPAIKNKSVRQSVVHN